MAYKTFTFISDGNRMPEGEYMVTIWDSGEVDLAWRWRPRRSIVWGPPLRGEQTEGS